MTQHKKNLFYVHRINEHDVALREREPSVEIEIRWCPAHKGIPANEVAPPASRMTTGSSGWRLLTATGYSHGQLPWASEKKWPEAWSWCERRRLGKGYAPGERQARPDPSQGGEANGLEVMPAQVRACPHGRVPEEHE